MTFLSLLAGALLGASAPAGATGRIGVQVLALQPEAGVARDSVKLLTDFLVSELSRRPQLQVFAQSDLEQLLRAAKEERNLECNQDADSCLAEVAGAMGAQWLIGGNVGLLGDRLLINVRLTDTHRHQMLAHVTEQTSLAAEDMLEAVKRLVPRLLEEATPNAEVAVARHERARTTAYWLLGSTIVAGIAGVAAGIVSGVYWSQAANASQDYLANNPSGVVQTGQGNGQYAKTKSQIVPWGVAGGIALGAAVGLGISTGIVW